jgi:hypothetical protein
MGDNETFAEHLIENGLRAARLRSLADAEVIREADRAKQVEEG